MKKITTVDYNFPSFCDHSQLYSEMNSADVQRESEDDMKDGQPAFKKFCYPNQQGHSTEMMKGSYDFPSQHGGDWQRFKYTRPESIYSDNVIPRAHMFLDNNEIAAHVGQPFWFDHDETQISYTKLIQPCHVILLFLKKAKEISFGKLEGTLKTDAEMPSAMKKSV